MNDFDNKGGVDSSGAVQDNSQDGVADTANLAKPKMVMKDSSKYVKKKPTSKMQQAPSQPSLGTPVGNKPIII